MAPPDRSPLGSSPAARREAGEVRAIVGVTIVGVRRGDSMANAVSRSHAAHFDGCVPGLGAVVDPGKKVAVNVDHDAVFAWNMPIPTTTIRTHPHMDRAIG